MPSTYQLASDDVREMAKMLMINYHNELFEHGVKIDYIFAFGELDEETSEKLAPAIMHHGWPAAGLASRTKLKDRVKGMGDCEILLDGDEWPKMTYAQQLALLDHELEHFELKRDKFGSIEKDDIDRPKISMREHDRQHGWFDNIAQRHGINSNEVKQFRAIITEAGGAYVPHARLADTTEDPVTPEIQDAVTEIAAGSPSPAASGAVRKLIPKAAADEPFKVTLSSNGGPEVDVTKHFSHLKVVRNESEEEEIKQCATFVIEEQNASTVMLQRKFQIGYTRASRIMDELEARGIVGPLRVDSSGTKSRVVLASKENNESPN